MNESDERTAIKLLFNSNLEKLQVSVQQEGLVRSFTIRRNDINVVTEHTYTNHCEKKA